MDSGRKPTELKPYVRVKKEKSLVYGQGLTNCSYVFEFTSPIYQERGAIFTALFGKNYPLWKKHEDYLKHYTGRAEELFLDKGNVFYYHTNYDDSNRLLTYYAWMNQKHMTYFHIDVMWKVKKSNLILFRDEVLTPLLKVLYNDPPHLRRVAFRYGNHALNRKRFFSS